MLIAARRPNSPLLAQAPARGVVAASASPTAERRDPTQAAAPQVATPPPNGSRRDNPPPRRSARIVKLPAGEADEQEKLRLRLLDRLMASQGRSAISRAATEYREAGFAFPEEQEVQLQLLEHFDEALAQEAVLVLARLLVRTAPIKRPVLEQRLRRLEEYADDPSTREAAAALRRTIRA